MRERGLKFEQYRHYVNRAIVAPHAGAWIEIASCWTSRIT